MAVWEWAEKSGMFSRVPVPADLTNTKEWIDQHTVITMQRRAQADHSEVLFVALNGWRPHGIDATGTLHSAIPEGLHDKNVLAVDSSSYAFTGHVGDEQRVHWC